MDANVIPTMLASASAGTICRIPMHPIDTCKARMQVSSLRRPSFVRTFSHTIRREGIRGLYEGFGIAFFGSAPASCLYFTSFEYTKRYLIGNFELARRNPFMAHFVAGLTAECFSCLVWVPIDVIKERLQTQSSLTNTSMRYDGNIDAIRTVARKEGLRGIYRGYGATVASFGPFSALYLMFYEQCKSMCTSWFGVKHEDDLPFWARLASGATSGGMASWLTNPLDMAKLRIQVQRGRHSGSFNFQYRHVLDGMVRIAKKDGFTGLFKGAGARVAFHAPSTAITIALYEEFRILFTR